MLYDSVFKTSKTHSLFIVTAEAQPSHFSEYMLLSSTEERKAEDRIFGWTVTLRKRERVMGKVSNRGNGKNMWMICERVDKERMIRKKDRKTFNSSVAECCFQ